MSRKGRGPRSIDSSRPALPSSLVPPSDDLPGIQKAAGSLHERGARPRLDAVPSRPSAGLGPSADPRPVAGRSAHKLLPAPTARSGGFSASPPGRVLRLEAETPGAVAAVVLLGKAGRAATVEKPLPAPRGDGRTANGVTPAMDKRTGPSPYRHAHEQHLVLVRQCAGCARWIVLRGSLDHVGVFSDQGAARAAAKQMLHDLAGHPDPDPLHIEITRTGHVVATGLSPVAPIEASAAA